MNPALTKKLLKLGLSTLLIVLILQFIDIQEVLILFQDVNVYWFGLGVLVVLFDQTFMGIKWHILLSALRIKVPIAVPIIAYLRGRAFKYLVPSTLGIDAYKAYYVRKFHPETAPVISSIVVERFFGILSSLLLVIFLLYFFAEPFDFVFKEWIGVISIAGILLAIIGLYTLINNIAFFAKLHLWQKLPKKVNHFLQPAFANLITLQDKRPQLYGYIGLSVIEKFFFGLVIYICARALGMEGASVYYICAATPLLALLERIPISVSSIGIREGLFVALFAPIGISAAEALAMALLLRAVEITQILLLIGIWYVDPTPPPTDEELQQPV